jgi:hypothetical protein
VRIACFALGDGCCEVVFSHHHILMDGWCLGILQHEFVAALKAGGLPALPPPTPFSRYIQWLGARDAAAARQYWRDHLAGYEELASLARGAEPTLQHPASHEVAFDAATGARLSALALRAGVTPATLVHAIWGVLLGRLLDREDVVFGSVIANRPEEIPGIEQMLGLFINAVPVRVAWDDASSFLALLRRMQRAMLARRPHEFLSLAEIQAEAGPGRTLFDHVMLVQNYPLEQQMQAEAGVRIARVELFEHTHYPLAVSVVLGQAPCFRLEHDPRCLPPAEIARVERLLRHLVGLLLDAPDRPLSELPLAPPHPPSICFAARPPLKKGGEGSKGRSLS